MNNQNQDIPIRSIRSITSAGESVSIDGSSMKAEDRDKRNNDKANIACRRVRPTFGRIVFRGI